MSRPGATGWKLVRSTLGHDGRGGLALTLADAGAASNAYRNESRDQSDEYFFHWNSPLFHATRCTLRASLHRWSPAEANGSPAPETVGHFKGDCVLGDTVTRRAQQNLPESGTRSAPGTHYSPSISGLNSSSSALRLDRLLRLRWLTARCPTPSHLALHGRQLIVTRENMRLANGQHARHL